MITLLFLPIYFYCFFAAGYNLAQGEFWATKGRLIKKMREWKEAHPDLELTDYQLLLILSELKERSWKEILFFKKNKDMI